MKPLESLSIRARVVVAFLVLLLTVVVFATVNAQSFNAIQKNFAVFSDLSRQSKTIYRLDRTTRELTRSVQIYSFTGYPGVASSVEESLRQLDHQLDTIHTEIEAKEARALVEEMRGHIQLYSETFKLVIEERVLRDRLVRENLPQEAAAFLRALTEIEAEQGRAKVTPIREDWMKLEAELFRYLEQPELERMARASKITRSAQQKVAALGPSMSREKVERTLEVYGATVQRIAQARRAYLYLQGVVLAGESAELMHASTALLDLVVLNIEPAIEQATEGGESARRLGYLTGGIVFLLGLGLAIFLSRTITAPLEDLTIAFRALANDEVIAPLKAVNQKNEFGVMARAADVFRAKNQQTKDLLEQAVAITRELEVGRAELHERNEEMEQFVYTVSHDLKSPIVSSLGFIGMCRDLAKKGRTEEAVARLDIVEKSNQRMAKLVDDLLNLSRVGRAETEVISNDVNHIVACVLDARQSGIESADVELMVGELGVVLANETRLTQVFDNLIGNALKYGTPEQGRPTLEIGRIDEGDEIRLFVRDNGVGIEPAYHERVFGLFQRLESTSEGTGIGLAIVARVAAQHHGRVWIESEGQGMGTTFWIAFPNVDEAEPKGNT